MKIATFNINGIKARIDALPQWLDEAQPDVAILQEIKSVDEGFPRELFKPVSSPVAMPPACGPDCSPVVNSPVPWPQWGSCPARIQPVV